jgi:Sigma-54 interaction domain
VLISGPTGVGKELCANYIHQHTARARASFVPANSEGLPVELIENELFGHVGGALTGARLRGGLVAAAEGGTLFFDEIDSLPLVCQAKLLRFLQLQDKNYRRLGETRLRHATNAARNAPKSSASASMIISSLPSRQSASPSPKRRTGVNITIRIASKMRVERTNQGSLHEAPTEWHRRRESIHDECGCRCLLSGPTAQLGNPRASRREYAAQPRILSKSHRQRNDERSDHSERCAASY